MWLWLRRRFNSKFWSSGMGDEIQATLRTCPGCNNRVAETDFDVDDRWRVLCLACRKQGLPRSAFEAYDDLVPTAAPPM